MHFCRLPWSRAARIAGQVARPRGSATLTSSWLSIVQVPGSRALELIALAPGPRIADQERPCLVGLARSVSDGSRLASLSLRQKKAPHDGGAEGLAVNQIRLEVIAT